jgi:hypothetical protein
VAQTIPVPQAAGAECAFEHERLDVSQVALEFQALVPQLVPRRGYASLRDQLDRASSFYLIARGSAMESAAVLDVLLARGVLAPAAHGPARGLLVRVTQMLTRLARRMR